MQVTLLKHLPARYRAAIVILVFGPGMRFS